MSAFPRWTWADRPPFTPALRVEVEHETFVDYIRANEAWRQKTHPMTHQESVAPERCRLHDWRTNASEWPAVDDDMAGWLDKTYEEVAS